MVSHFRGGPSGGMWGYEVSLPGPLPRGVLGGGRNCRDLSKFGKVPDSTTYLFSLHNYILAALLTRPRTRYIINPK